MKHRTRVAMNTGTRMMADRRTRRQRTRTDQERTAIVDSLYPVEDCDGTCRAGQYCVQHGDLVEEDW